jgi:hypothetical protein
MVQVRLNGNDLFQVSSQYGVTDNVHLTPHTGIDLVMKTGTRLFSPTDGIISKVVDYGHENIGKGIIIKTNTGESVIMGHLSDIKVRIGQKIHEGDFVALSGNTGHSTGSHLHLGMKSPNGTFINPDKLLDNSDNHTLMSGFFANGKVKPDNFAVDKDSDGIISNVQSFMDFIGEVKKEGLFHAIYGDSFFGVMKNFFADLFNDLFQFLLSNGDLFFLLPAIFVMFITFFVGRNKYTKYIIPLWFAYFVDIVFLNIIK